MKTAISLPDELFAAAERAARRRGVSRSRLYAEALRAYLQQHEDDEVTAQLDAVYREVESGLDPLLARIQRASLGGDDW